MKNTPEFNCILFAGVGLLSGIFLTGCGSAGPQTRVEIQNAVINGQPARFALDTGAPTTMLFSTGADRLDLKVTPPSVKAQVRASMNKGVALGSTDPVQVSLGGQTFTTPLKVLKLPWYLPDSLGVDGLVGWAEIRDNILVFDGDKRTISSVANVPEETTGWLKLKVRQNPHLFLELPRPDGTTGIIMVDTGNPSGVSLPPAEWKTWRTAHPQAPSVSMTYYSPESGAVDGEIAWADEIALGALSLTDVAVQEADSSESREIRNYAGTIGLYALSRLDLVVDGKNGFAYLQPKPAPGPYFPGFDRPGVTKDSARNSPGDEDWTVADNVHIQPPPLPTDSSIGSAHKKYKAKDYAGAIADLTNVIEQNPEDLTALSDRANTSLILGDNESAVADFNQILKLDSKNFLAYRDRGVAREIQGDFDGALADFNQAITLRPNGSINPLPHLYRITLLLRTGRSSENSATEVAGLKEGWPKMNAQFITGSLSETAYLAAAAKGDEAAVRQQQAAVFYYIGMKRLISGDQTGARDSFQKCLATGESEANEYLLAQGELTRLK